VLASRQASLTLSINSAETTSMGFSLSWIAVRGIPAQAVMERTRLRPTGAKGDYAVHGITSTVLPGDWILVVAEGCDHRIVDRGNLEALSRGCEVVACTVEEHVMVCTAELWSDGLRTWRLVHDAQESIDHLAVEGDAPPDYAGTRDQFSAQQAAEGGADAGVDYYFEIPLAVAKSLVGFKHDELNEIMESNAEILEDLAAPPSVSKSWWQLWK
jgi:hypothetical protein